MAGSENDSSPTRYSVYTAFRDARTKRGESHFDNYWKNTQLVAGGAIGGSLTLLKDLVPLLGPGEASILKFSWICLGACIASSMFASFCSGHSIKSEISDIDQWWDGVALKPDEAMPSITYSSKTKKFRSAEFIFEIIAPVLLLLGLGAMILAFGSVTLKTSPSTDSKPVPVEVNLKMEPIVVKVANVSEKSSAKQGQTPNATNKRR